MGVCGGQSNQGDSQININRTHSCIYAVSSFDYCWMLNLHGQHIGTTAEACWKLSRALQSWKWMKSPPVAHNETFIAHAALQVFIHDFLSSTIWFTHLSMPHLPHPCSNAFHNLKAFIMDECLHHIGERKLEILLIQAKQLNSLSSHSLNSVMLESSLFICTGMNSWDGMVSINLLQVTCVLMFLDVSVICLTTHLL